MSKKDKRKNCYKLRKIIFKKERKCQKCGSETNLQLHHIQPIFLGGFNSPANAMLLCKGCHKKETIRIAKSYLSKDLMYHLEKKLKKRNYSEMETYNILISLPYVLT